MANERVQYLSKEMLITYLYNELGNSTVKVTTHLDKQNCWTGKISMEVVHGTPKDDRELAEFYLKILCEEKLNTINQ